VPQTKPRKKVRPKPRAKGKLRQLEKGKVRVIYGKAGRTPSSRAPRLLPGAQMRTPQPATALAAYVEENKDTGISISELIWQFQEYDCEHKEVVPVLTSNLKAAMRCEECGKIEIKVKNG
jgi:hypothetical protein